MMRVPKFSGTILKSAVPVVVCNMLYALLVKFFLLPAGLVTGGTTGLALIAEQLWQIPISGFVFAFNVVMLIIGWLVLGKAFALTTIASSILYPFFLEICNRVFGPGADHRHCPLYRVLRHRYWRGTGHGDPFRRFHRRHGYSAPGAE